MYRSRKYKSEIAEAVHSNVAGMHRAGTIDQATMHSFDDSCLIAPAPLEPRQIKLLRRQHKLSQPRFARYLNISESTVEKWESGAKKPSGSSLKLLSIVQKHGLEILS